MKGSKRSRGTVPKAVWIVSIAVVVLMGVAVYAVKTTAYRAGYDRGFSDGYSKGEGESDSAVSYSAGYDAGYIDALSAYGLGPDNSVISEEASWPYRLLMTAWTEIGETGQEKPRELHVTEHSISMSSGQEDTVFAYTLPESVYSQARPDGEVYLELTDCREFVHLIFHEEKLEDGTVLPILSATIAEMDGRGEIVLMEFVRTEDAHRVSPSFRSETCIVRDEQDVPPMEKTE